eukprot:jgi/Botrbrau1/14958/Bobra.0018s0061.1
MTDFKKLLAEILARQHTLYGLKDTTMYDNDMNMLLSITRTCPLLKDSSRLPGCTTQMAPNSIRNSHNLSSSLGPAREKQRNENKFRKVVMYSEEPHFPYFFSAKFAAEKAEIASICSSAMARDPTWCL